MPSTPDWPALLSDALAHNPHHSARYIQLATLSDSGEVTCRTLVCRRWLPDTGTLVATTDLRSHKVRGLRRQEQAEACWYLPARSEQFRLRGNVVLTGAEQGSSLREEIWEALPASGKVLFTGPAPGTPLPPGYSGPDNATPSHLPDCFALLTLQPVRVDYLNLSTSPHQRWLFEYHRGEAARRQWHARALVP